MNSLENRGTLLKGTTTTVISEEEGFHNFIRSLMTAGLSLTKSVLNPLAKIALVPLGSSANSINNFK